VPTGVYLAVAGCCRHRLGFRDGPDDRGRLVNLSISTDVVDGVSIVHAGGDLDVYTAPRLKETLAAAMASGQRVVLDLSEVHFIDSTALGVLVSALRQSTTESGDFRLVVDDPYLLKIFRITGFDGLFPIFPKVADAVSGI
jgi:anti-sigma B factor antagonist